VLKLDLLRLRHAESTADVCKWFLGEHDRAGTHGANLADELNVFNCFREELQAAAILFEEAKSRAIDLAVEEIPPDRLLDRDRGRSVVSPWAIPTVIAWMIGIRINHTSARAPQDGARRACDIRTAFILVKEVRASRLYVSRGANCQTAARWISCGGELDSPRSG